MSRAAYDYSLDPTQIAALQMSWAEVGWAAAFPAVDRLALGVPVGRLAGAYPAWVL